MSGEIAWCAGFFDGEGCIALYHNGKQWLTMVTLTQRDEMPIIIFEKQFGGKRFMTGPKRDAIRLSFRKLEAQEMLSTLLPYLIVKRTQAVLLLEFWQIACDTSLSLQRGAGLERALVIAEEIKSLKRPWNI